MSNLLKRTVDLYVDGFRNMTVGRDLWLLIIIKCVVIFAIVKVLFFPDVLAKNYSDDTERAGAVREALSAPHK